MSMHAIDHLEAKKFLKGKLGGSELDCFRVYSIVLELDFLTGPQSGATNQSVWLTVMGDIFVTDSKRWNRNIRQSRPEVISNIYELFGQEVHTVELTINGEITLGIEDKILTVCRDRDDEPQEEIWMLSPDTPSTNANHAWAITLLDTGEFWGSLS